MDLSKSFVAAATAVEEKKEKVAKTVPTGIVNFLGAVAKENVTLAAKGDAELRLSYGAFTALLIKEGVLPAACAKVAQSSIALVQALPTEHDIGNGTNANLQALIVDRNGKCAKWPVPAKIALVKDGPKLLEIYAEYSA
jgi:hypothetical protein